MKILNIALLGGALSLAAVAAQAQTTAVPAPTQAPGHNQAVKAPDETRGELAKGKTSFTKAEAQSRLQKAGYSDVKDLTLDPDGLWQATASKDGQSARVALDYKGAIASQ